MKVAILWLLNEHGQILMARRATGLSTDAGVWAPSVSGKVDHNESYQEAIIREVQEELGVSPDEISPVFLHNAFYGGHEDGRKRDYGIFYAIVGSDITKRLVLEPREVAEVGWMTIEEVISMVHSKSEEIIIPDAVDLWEAIFTNLKTVVA